MSDKQSLENLLHSLGSASTRFRPKSSELIDTGLRVVELYLGAAECDRRAISSGTSSRLRRKLLSISGFMAEEAMNANDPKWIRASVLLHVIEDFTDDFMENFRYLILSNHAAVKIGVNMRHLIDEAMAYSSERTSGFLKVFGDRDDSLNRLGAFGVVEDCICGRFTFKPA